MTVLLILSGCREDDEIHVITREIGSGTRKTFEESFDVLIRPDAQVSDSTGVVLSCVASDRNAIGYISGAAMSTSVKKADIGGVMREMYLVTLGEPEGAAKDFTDYICSTDGQRVAQENGYVPVEAKKYQSLPSGGKITVAGSSAVAPLLEKLSEAYMDINPDIRIEIQQSDSYSGLRALSQGICDIAMSSRDLTQDELSQGLVPIIIAYDELCVILHPGNNIDVLNPDQVSNIFSGEIACWSEIN